MLSTTATAANTRLGLSGISRSAFACGLDRDGDSIADGAAEPGGNADGRSRDSFRQFHGILDLSLLTSRGVIYEEPIDDGSERNGLTISSTRWASSEKDLLQNL